MALLGDAKRAKFAAELSEHQARIEAEAAGLLTRLSQRKTQLLAMKAAVEADTDFTVSDAADVQTVLDLITAKTQEVYDTLIGG